MGIQAAEISAILKDQIKNFGQDAEVAEVGQVLSVGDGIARVRPVTVTLPPKGGSQPRVLLSHPKVGTALLAICSPHRPKMIDGTWSGTSASVVPPIVGLAGTRVGEVPIVLGRGERLWDGLEGVQSRFAIESVVSPGAGVVHRVFTRLPR